MNTTCLRKAHKTHTDTGRKNTVAPKPIPSLQPSWGTPFPQSIMTRGSPKRGQPFNATYDYKISDAGKFAGVFDTESGNATFRFTDDIFYQYDTFAFSDFQLLMQTSQPHQLFHNLKLERRSPRTDYFRVDGWPAVFDASFNI